MNKQLENESSTNSPIGSLHWFNTIVSKHKSIGEFLKDKTPSEEVLQQWGKYLYESSKELLTGLQPMHDEVNGLHRELDLQVKQVAYVHNLMAADSRREAALQQENASLRQQLDVKWVPVSERLPTIDDGNICAEGLHYTCISLWVIFEDGFQTTGYYNIYTGNEGESFFSEISINKVTHFRALSPAPGKEANQSKEKLYPCARCGTMRTQAEGGTTFTVCDDCWDKPRKEAQDGK